MMKFWYLDENKVPQSLPLEDLTTYMRKNGDPRKQVARDEPILGTVVSTVFLAHDTTVGRTMLPVLFETMIFSETHNDLRGDAERYCTWEEAVAGHVKWCKHVVDVVIGDRDAGDLE